MSSTSFRLVFVLSAALALFGCKKDVPGAGGSAAVDAGPTKTRIAVIPKGTTHEFWKAVHAGAVKASRESPCEIVWKGPLKEDDLKAQIDVVQSFVAQGVSGIVLAPLSDKGLVGAVHAAKEAKIPVVVFDSDLSGNDYVSFVATDNVAAGKMAANALADALGRKGRVVLLRYQEGSASTMNREKGFLEGIKAFPDITVVSDNQYGGATTETASKTSENVLAGQKAKDGGVQGVFTPNESTTFGMLLALRHAGIAGKVKHVGFDASDKLIAAVRSGEINGLVMQDPFGIGYRATKTMLAHLAGEKVEARIDTGAKLATKENLDSPDIQTLVRPDVKAWLGE